MENVHGGRISLGCALGAAGAILALAAISATATPATGVALGLEAAAYLSSVGGFATGCARELGII